MAVDRYAVFEITPAWMNSIDGSWLTACLSPLEIQTPIPA